MVSVGAIEVPLPLWRAATMDLRFGEITIRNVQVRLEIDENGQTNLERILVKRDGSADLLPRPMRRQSRHHLCRRSPAS